MSVQGIDVSRHNTITDFRKVKGSGIDFVIIRAGYGREISQKDPQFETNYKNAKAAGLNVGAYWYSYAQSVEEAKIEAKVCLQAIKGKKFEYPIYFDLEENTQLSRGSALCTGQGVLRRTRKGRIFCRAVYVKILSANRDFKRRCETLCGLGCRVQR